MVAVLHAEVVATLVAKRARGAAVNFMVDVLNNSNEEVEETLLLA